MFNTLKKTVFLFIFASLVLFSGCSDDPERVNVPTTEELLASQYDQLVTAFGDKCNEDDIIRYIRSWADEREYSYKIEKGNIIAITRKASKGCDDYPSTVLHCSVSGENISEEMQYLSVLLYTVSDIKKHGPVTALITPSEHENDIPASYLENDNFISLSYNEDMNIVTSAAASSKYRLKKNISYTNPRFNCAYKITIRNLNGGKVSTLEEGHPNPILNINSILANFRTNGLLYDLADFDGGFSSDNYGRSASAVIVVSSDDEEKVIKRLDKAISKFKKKWSDLEENYTYSYEKVPLPSKVLSPQSTSDIVSLFYTMITGVYLTDEETDETVAYTNIGRLRINNNEADVRIKAVSKEESVLNEMDDSVKILAEISDFRYKKVYSTPLWKEDADTGLLGSFQLAADSVTGNTLKETGTFETHLCAKLNKRKDSLSLIDLETNYNQWDDAANILIEFLKEITAADIISEYFSEK